MSTIKTIDFVVKGDRPGRLAIRTVEVDMSTLSDAAKAIAYQIDTTVRADDYSLVDVRSDWTERENCQRHGWSDDRIARTEVFIGESLDKPRELRWNSWDLLRPTESPAEHFARHAAALADDGFHIVTKQDRAVEEHV